MTSFDCESSSDTNSIWQPFEASPGTAQLRVDESALLPLPGVGTCQGNFDGKARQGKSCLGKFVARQGKFLASFFGERYKKIFKWKFIFINSKRF